MSPASAVRLGDRARRLVRERSATVLILTYAATRLLLLPVFWLAWRGPFEWQKVDLGTDPTWWSLVSFGWDGHWYEVVAREGYPRDLPVDPDTGRVLENPWAFYPLFPLLVRAFMMASGLPWDVAAPLLSFVFGLVAVLMVNQLVRVSAPGLVDMWPLAPFVTALGVVVFPAPAALGVAYSESLALLAVVGFLWCVVQERYVLAVLPLCAVGLSRGVALPLAAVVAWHVILRFRALSVSGRQYSRPSKGDCARLTLLFIVVIAASVGWPWFVGWFTGVERAYAMTQEAWRPVTISTVPFSVWFQLIGSTLAATIVVLAILVALAWWAMSPKVRSFGPELHMWSLAYLGFIVALVGPAMSWPRFFLLTIIFPAAVFMYRRSFRATVLIASLLFGVQAGLTYLAWGSGLLHP